MLKLEDLKRREYIDKECVHFEIDIPSEDNNPVYNDIIIFRKVSEDTWIINHIVHLNSYGHVITFTEVIDNISNKTSLILIAGIGINMMKGHLTEIASNLSKTTQKMSSLIRDM